MRAFLSVILVLATLYTAPVVQAADNDNGLFLSQRFDHGYPLVNIERYEDIEPVTPVIPVVKFMEMDPPENLKKRIDRLVYGIQTNVPSEYDYYGYEIRRYMAGILDVDALNDVARVEKELGNIRRAAIILNYWEKEFRAEVSAIEKAMQTDKASSEARTFFRYNKNVGADFFYDANRWVKTNKKMLEFFFLLEGEYTAGYPNMIFKTTDASQPFRLLYRARDKALVKINIYTPFTIMAY